MVSALDLPPAIFPFAILAAAQPRTSMVNWKKLIAICCQLIPSPLCLERSAADFFKCGRECLLCAELIQSLI